MELSTIVFHMDSQPNFEELRENGWYHPPGLREGEILEKSLIKDFGDYRIQIVQHRLTDFQYTQAFLHAKPERSVMKKGEGKGMSRDTALHLISTLYKEINEDN